MSDNTHRLRGAIKKRSQKVENVHNSKCGLFEMKGGVWIFSCLPNINVNFQCFIWPKNRFVLKRSLVNFKCFKLFSKIPNLPNFKKGQIILASLKNALYIGQANGYMLPKKIEILKNFHRHCLHVCIFSYVCFVPFCFCNSWWSMKRNNLSVSGQQKVRLQ